MVNRRYLVVSIYLAGIVVLVHREDAVGLAVWGVLSPVELSSMSFFVECVFDCT